ncbi:MAG TPA: glycogen/starch synthase, partial [Bacteroidales bacterium]|nr:glycogen/starch synthase [Bacteroidales bacterium]
MKKANVLFVAQEITPYLKETPMGRIGRYLPQGIQERGKEIRTFMPRYGSINERRNQLHEVIRLSGMNLIIDDADHPLIIKVASIQSARMQIYFIDNEEYFQRKAVIRDKNGKFFPDNDERAVFFSRGVLETVKKLGWPPDIVHCHGWMSSLVPLYIKRAFRDNPLFTDTKVVFSVYDDQFSEKFSKNLVNKVAMEGISEDDLKYYTQGDYVSITR